MGIDNPAEKQLQVVASPRRETAKFFRIRELNKFQHYKNRNPPWVKLHGEQLDDYDFTQLPDSVKFHALALIYLASKTGNKIPNDPAWVAGRIGANDPINFGALLSIKFLEPWRPRAQSQVSTGEQFDLPDADEEGETAPGTTTSENHASNLLASCKQVASAETETETEAEPEAHTETAAPASAGRHCECCGSCVFSAFSFKDALALVERWRSEGRKVGGRPIENAGGLARKLHQEGTADGEISLLLNPPARREFTDEACPSCLGTKLQTVPGKGARPCPVCVDEQGKRTGRKPNDFIEPRDRSP